MLHLGVGTGYPSKFSLLWQTANNDLVCYRVKPYGRFVCSGTAGVSSALPDWNQSGTIPASFAPAQSALMNGVDQPGRNMESEISQPGMFSHPCGDVPTSMGATDADAATATQVAAMQKTPFLTRIMTHLLFQHALSAAWYLACRARGTWNGRSRSNPSRRWMNHPRRWNSARPGGR